ncbi:hypothetical protein ABSA28_00726 [Candidatus Hepatincolaceae symbiont of Richtersius coronifer]
MERIYKEVLRCLFYHELAHILGLAPLNSEHGLRVEVREVILHLNYTVSYKYPLMKADGNVYFQINNIIQRSLIRLDRKN